MDKARIIQYQSSFDAIAQRIEIEGEHTQSKYGMLVNFKSY